MHGGGLGEELFGAHAVEGDLQQHIAAQGRGSQDHALAEGFVLDHVALVQLQHHRRLGGGSSRQAAPFHII